MLVLTRKSNQSIMIGDDIEVSVLSVMGEKVRIGIQAPQKVPVFRKEIYLEIHREAGAVTPERDGRGRADPSRPMARSRALRWTSRSASSATARRAAPSRTRCGGGASLRPHEVLQPLSRLRGRRSAEQEVERAEHHDRDHECREDQGEN